MRSGTAKALIRKTVGLFNRNDKYSSPQANNRGELCIAQSLPRESELTRLGGSWIGMPSTDWVFKSAIPTGFSDVVMALTNRANPGPNSPWCVLSTIGFRIAVGEAAPLILGIACQEISTSESLLETDPAQMPVSVANQVRYRGSTRVVSIQNAPNNGGWHRVGQSLTIGNTVNATGSVEWDVYGRYLIPPGGMFVIAGMTNTGNPTGATGRPFVIWHEVQLPITS